MIDQIFERERSIGLLHQMQTIRTFETRVEVLFKDGHLPGFVHSYAGQEAIAVGVCSCLTKSDYITSTHRGHGHAIAKGISLNAIFAELYGKETGTCSGKGGSMHVADFSIGMLGANGIVGGGFGIATGAALAMKYLKKPEVAVCFFGDGAANKGTFHEALNFAGVHKLPVIFVCENNRYAQFTSASRTTAIEDISIRAQSYGIVGDSIDGNDLTAVIDSAHRAIERARAGEGSTLLNMRTYRHSGHFVGDPEEYRASEEVQQSKDVGDPITRFTELLISREIISPSELENLNTEVSAQIERAHEFAQASDYPDASEALRDVWTDGGAR